MILCSPCSLGRRQGEVGVVGVRVVGVVVVIFGIGVVLVLLLQVLLLGAPRWTIVRRPLVVGGDVPSEDWWAGKSSTLDDGLLGNLMGLSDIFFVD
jgi:hypothetical protein